MTRVVYSQRLFAVQALTSTPGIVGPVVPAGVIWVLRDLDIVVEAGTSGNNMAVLNQVGGLLVFLSVGTATPGPNYAWRGRQIYAQGEQIGFHVFSGTWDIAASGYQLTLP